MTVAVGNAYSPEYDFAPYTGEAVCSYVIATIPRSGSTFLSHELWKTGVLGAPLEYLNFEGGMLDRSALQNLVGYMETVRRLRTSPNGVFGLKVFPNDLREITSSCRALLGHLLTSRFIFLTRSNKVSQAVSYARAKQTGAWVGTSEEERAPIYVEREIDEALEQILVQERFWLSFFARLSIQPLALAYEDVAADLPASVQKVGEFLGVAVAGVTARATPEVRIQADIISAEWVERYRESLSERPRHQIAEFLSEGLMS